MLNKVSCKKRPNFLKIEVIWQVNCDLIVIYRIIHNLVDLKFDTFFSIIPTFKLYQLRRHVLDFHKPISPSMLIRAIFFISNSQYLEQAAIRHYHFTIDSVVQAKIKPF